MTSPVEITLMLRILDVLVNRVYAACPSMPADELTRVVDVLERQTIAFDGAILRPTLDASPAAVRLLARLNK